MPTPGYVFKDGQPIPDDEMGPGDVVSDGHAPIRGTPTSAISSQGLRNRNATSEQQRSPTIKGPIRSADHPDSNVAVSPTTSPNRNKLRSMENVTDSHVLAQADHDEKGAAQMEHFETEVKDLGWNQDPRHIPQPLVGGLSNEEVWLLVRRFNKQMYHVKSHQGPVMSALDLETAEEDEFSPDKLRANVERLYMTVIVGVITFGKHIARLRSWREPRRTAAFTVAYFLAWILNMTMPLLMATVIALIVYPPSRDVLFPPAPLALVDSKTGGIQSPMAGVLGSHDSVTGAPEKHKGEAVEHEAHNFVSGIGTIALSSAVGKHEPAGPNADGVNEKVPDPTDLASHAAEGKAAAGNSTLGGKHDRTKEPMEQAMWSKMRPTMHIVGEVSDGWERFANALSPTKPFPQDLPRLKLAALVLPIFLGSIFTTPFIVVKGAEFGIGFGFFGDPIIQRGIELLNKKFPHWQKLLELRNTILRGVPTNAQLTLTLLRIGEANKAPLPPPPHSNGPPPDHAAELDKDELTLDASHEEIHDAITADEPNPDFLEHPDHPDKKKHGSKIVGFFKGTTKAGVDTKLGADRLKATIGSTRAKDRLGVLPKASEQIPSGPVDFKARYQGKKGWAYVNTSATVPCVSFSTHQSDGTGEQSSESLRPVFSIPINEITELKKIGGMGWKAKLVVGWATNKTVADGLEIVDRHGGRWHLTAIILREELFNRLVSMGPQKWESW